MHCIRDLTVYIFAVFVFDVHLLSVLGNPCGGLHLLFGIDSLIQLGLKACAATLCNIGKLTGIKPKQSKICVHNSWDILCILLKKCSTIWKLQYGQSIWVKYFFIFSHILKHGSFVEPRQIWGIWKLRPAYSPETPNLGQNRWCFVLCDLEIWWMTLENNRASLLCCFKLCATFHSHRWIQTGVTVRKRSIWVKIDDFLSRVILQYDVWPWKTIGHLFYATSSFVHHFVAIADFKLELQSGNAQFGSNSMIFRAVWPWNLTDDIDKE